MIYIPNHAHIWNEHLFICVCIGVYECVFVHTRTWQSLCGEAEDNF